MVTPDTYRKTSVVENAEKGQLLLMSNEEALTRAHGAVESFPQGNIVHKAIQTNLVDVICRGPSSFSLFSSKKMNKVLIDVVGFFTHTQVMALIRSCTGGRPTNCWCPIVHDYNDRGR